MAYFEKAYKITMKIEGRYNNDPNDAGGETYKGISRVYHPGWDGWLLIDLYKKVSSFPAILDSDTKLQQMVHLFYKQTFWDVNRLDEIKSQPIAEELFDTGVNMGYRRACKYLQKALNYLNRNGKLYRDLVVDGIIGQKTFNAFNKILSEAGGENLIYKMLNVLQAMHYMDYMGKSTTQEKYARGWFTRVDFIKK